MTAIPTSTNSFYDSAAKRMSSLTALATQLQTQIATGKKYQTPSENVAVSQQIAEFDRKDANETVYASNMTLSTSLLKQSDSALGSVSDQLQRAQELVTQAANGTMGPADRAAVGDELDAIVNALVSLGNTKDLTGQPLFGSASGTAAVVRNADGSFAYNAATKLSEIPIADGETVQATETAARVFTSAKGGDILATLAALAASLRDGTGTSADASAVIDKLSAAGDQVSAVRASVGAREAHVALQQTLLDNARNARAEQRSSLEDTDVTSAITELQKTMTILSATQASFSKLSSLSLFDYLR